MPTTMNPATNEPIKSYDAHTLDEANAIIDTAHKAFADWKAKRTDERAAIIRKAGDILKDKSEEFATTMTEEMGKIRSQAIAEIEKCASVCYYYADNAMAFLEDEHLDIEAGKAIVTYQPQGVILGIMPWNFPFWQVFRFAVPTLMAGNTVCLKHASNVTGCALLIDQIFKDAGLPKGCYNPLIVAGKDMTDIIANDKIRGVSLTGSVEAGRKVGATAGQYLKKSVLELGGSDAYLVLKDADIDLAAKTCVKGRLFNTGQTCIAAKRFLVVEDVYDTFLRRLETEMKSVVMGDPNDESSTIGPMSSVDLRDELHDQVERTIKAGATCLMGGEIPDKDGAWYPPTLLTNVTEGMAAYHEELFGPVASVIKVKDEADAIAVSNSSEFGLGGGVFSTDPQKAIEIARTQLDTGNVAVNGFVASNPAVPFGGVKNSGYGRELARFGIHEFVNIKTVVVAD